MTNLTRATCGPADPYGAELLAAEKRASARACAAIATAAAAEKARFEKRRAAGRPARFDIREIYAKARHEAYERESLSHLCEAATAAAPRRSPRKRAHAPRRHGPGARGARRLNVSELWLERA